MNPSPPSPRRRTAEEAIAQANAKERIRNANAVWAAGVGMLFVGIKLLTQWHTWSRYHQDVAVHIHGGASFTLSFTAIAGIGAVAVSPIVFVIGRVRLRRALNAAALDPITGPILRGPVS